MYEFYERISLNNYYKRYIHQKWLKRIMNNKNSCINKILFMPTNGGGLGHLTRTLAVARRLKKMYPDVEIIFATTCSALNLIIEEGFLAYSLSSNDPGSINTNQKSYNPTENQLITIISRHNIDTLIFDGVIPYISIINTIKELANLNTIWIQRGMHKSGKSQTVISRESFFNSIIVPGEANLNNNSLRENDKFHYCPPIIYSNKEDLLPREVIFKMWNLDPNKKTVFIKGPNNDENNLISNIIENLPHSEDLQIVLCESIIAKEQYNVDSNVFILRDYPNSIYFNAFDFAIINSSYNIFHETIYFGVPTIIIPTKTTKTDDQVARAKIALKLGTGFVLTDFDEIEFKNAVSQLLDPSINKRMRKNTKNLFDNGAELAVQYIMQSIQ